MQVRADDLPLIRDVGFDVFPGETLGILGESGCGKSTLAAAIIGGLPGGLAVSKGTVDFEGVDLARTSPNVLRGLRAPRIALVSQEPALALNPVLSIGFQVEEVVRAHFPWGRDRVRQHTLMVLREAGLEDAEHVYAYRPHQLSGGQRQRAAIAQAVCCRPSLLIADEPTTALDPVAQRELMKLLLDLRERFGVALILNQSRHRPPARGRESCPRDVRRGGHRRGEGARTGGEAVPSIHRRTAANATFQAVGRRSSRPFADDPRRRPRAAHAVGRLYLRTEMRRTRRRLRHTTSARHTRR